MNRSHALLVAALALVGMSSANVGVAGLFESLCNSDCCDQPCDTLGCESSCCDSSGCDSSGCDSSDACDACPGCGQGCELCSCLSDMKLFACLKSSDHCFDDFISPMINFVYFEDPRTLTELRPIYVYHRTPNRVGTLGIPGGDIQLWAAQFRIALTDRLSLIATKDGYIVEDINDGPLDEALDDGWAAVSLGLKYNVCRDVCRGRIASVGFTYELPVGSRRALQAIGDGELHFFGTAGQRYWGGDMHLMTAFGARIPVDNDVQTTSFHWSGHCDYRLSKRVYYISEASWWHWTSSADTGLPLGVAGQDLFNLSATNVAGNDLITKNFGLKYKPSRNLELGLAYEVPLTGRDDVLRDRVQIDLILRR